MRRGSGGSNGGTEADSNADVVRVVKAALVAGFYPHVVRVRTPRQSTRRPRAARWRSVTTRRTSDTSRRISVGCFCTPRRSISTAASTSRSGSCTANGWRRPRCTSATTPWSDRTRCSCLEGDARVLHDEGLVKVDDWATFQAPARIGVLVKGTEAAGGPAPPRSHQPSQRSPRVDTHCARFWSCSRARDTDDRPFFARSRTCR